MKILRHLGADSEGFIRIFRAEFAEERGGTRRKPGDFNISPGCESLLSILRVLCALCVLCVEFCLRWQIRSIVNT